MGRNVRVTPSSSPFQPCGDPSAASRRAPAPFPEVWPLRIRPRRTPLAEAPADRLKPFAKLLFEPARHRTVVFPLNAQVILGGDGILTALQVLAVMLREDRPLSELKKLITRYPQILVNVIYERALTDEAVSRIEELSKQAEKELAGTGRVLIRPSGTEPKMRIMVEGEDDATINRVANELAGEIGKLLA